jgi:hypothetical protein
MPPGNTLERAPGQSGCYRVPVAVLSAHERAPRVLDVDGASMMPSAVFATEDGQLVAGGEAERRARMDPARFEPNPKRRPSAAKSTKPISATRRTSTSWSASSTTTSSPANPDGWSSWQ